MTTNKTPQRKHVVFVRSIESGRVALLGQMFINHKPDSDTPHIEEVSEELRPLTFRNADEVINGVQRRFWTISIPRAQFREFLATGKSVLPAGSTSRFVIAPGNQKEKELLETAAEAARTQPHRGPVSKLVSTIRG